MSEQALELLRAQVPERLYRFAEVFLETLDANAAAEAAGAPGKARELMRDRRTGAVLRALQGETAQAHADTRAGALAMLLRLATFDPRKAAGLTLADLPDDLAAAATVKIDGMGLVTITFDAKVRLAAIDRILQMCGDLPVAGQTGTAQVVFRGRSPEE